MSDSRYRFVVQNEVPYGLGAFVDIYPLDGLGNDYELACKQMKILRKYPRLMFLSTRKRLQFNFAKGNCYKIKKSIAYCYAKMKGKTYFKNKIQSLIDKDCFYDSSYVGCAVWGAGSRIHVFDKKKIGDLIPCQFEDMCFNVYKGWDYMLQEWYGNYMQYPPEKERVPRHLYDAYRVTPI